MDNSVAEILRNAPKGLRLYSPAFGMLRLIGVTDNNMGGGTTVDAESDESGVIYCFMPNGKYTEHGECQLFPSPTHRTWDGWQHLLFTYGNFITDTEGFRETLVISDDPNLAYDAKGNRAKICVGAYRFATEDEKKAFLSELGRNGYEWDESSLEMRLTKTERKQETDDTRLADNDSVTEYAIKDDWKLTLKKKVLDWPSSADKPECHEPLFKVGDWVTVRERQGDGSRYRCFYIDDMTAFAGKAYRIREAKNDRKRPTEGWLPDDGYLYTLEGDKVGWSWPSSALEPCGRRDSDSWSC